MNPEAPFFSLTNKTLLKTSKQTKIAFLCVVNI